MGRPRRCAAAAGYALGLELAPYPPHPVCRSRVVARVPWPQARLCASRSGPAAAARPPASRALPPLPPPPPPPSAAPARAPRAPSRGAAWALAAGGGWWCYGCMPPPAPGGAGVASAGSGPARRSPTVMLRPRAGAVPLVCCPRSCLCVCLVCEKDCEIVEIAISQYLKKNQLCYRLSASLNWWIVRCTFRRNRRRSTRAPISASTPLLKF